MAGGLIVLCLTLLVLWTPIAASRPLWQAAAFSRLPEGSIRQRVRAVLDHLPLLLVAIAILDLIRAHSAGILSIPHVADWSSTAPWIVWASGPDGTLLALMLGVLLHALAHRLVIGPGSDEAAAALSLRIAALVALVVGLGIEDAAFTALPEGTSAAATLHHATWPATIPMLALASGAWLGHLLHTAAETSIAPPIDPGASTERPRSVATRLVPGFMLLLALAIPLSPEAWAIDEWSDTWRVTTTTPALSRLVVVVGLLHLAIAAPAARWVADREAAKGGVATGRWKGLTAAFGLHALLPIAVTIPTALFLDAHVQAWLVDALRWMPWLLIGAIAGANLPAIGLDRHIRPEVRGAGIGVAFAAIGLCIQQPEALLFVRVTIASVILAPWLAAVVERRTSS